MYEKQLEMSLHRLVNVVAHNPTSQSYRSRLRIRRAITTLIRLWTSDNSQHLVRGRTTSSITLSTSGSRNKPQPSSVPALPPPGSIIMLATFGYY